MWPQRRTPRHKLNAVSRTGAGYSGEARCRVGLPLAADPRVRGTPRSQARAAAGPACERVRNKDCSADAGLVAGKSTALRAWEPGLRSCGPTEAANTCGAQRDGWDADVRNVPFRPHGLGSSDTAPAPSAGCSQGRAGWRLARAAPSAGKLTGRFRPVFSKGEGGFGSRKGDGWGQNGKITPRDEPA
jgi:hypothetical protein